MLAGLPLLWIDGLHIAQAINNDYLSVTLLGMVCALAAVGIGYIGYLLMRNHEQPGSAPGIFCAAIMIFVTLWIGEAIANASGDTGDPAIAMTIGGVVALLLLAGTVFLYLQPGWAQMLLALEDQGWFHGRPFKPNQGIRVRRGTVIGVLTVGICGIITLVWHRGFGYERPGLSNDWMWAIPGSAGEYVLPLMYKVHLLMPVLLGLVLVYFAWRLVNVPPFADFLIATEAEMNKVSWTTRRRLIQDTIVVLVTVFLLTLFLFLVDIMWIQILSNPYVRGIAVQPPRPAKAAAGQESVVSFCHGNRFHQRERRRRRPSRPRRRRRWLPNRRRRCRRNLPKEAAAAARRSPRPPEAPPTPEVPDNKHMVRRQGAVRPRGIDQGSDRAPRQDRGLAGLLRPDHHPGREGHRDVRKQARRQGAQALPRLPDGQRGVQRPHALPVPRDVAASAISSAAASTSRRRP